MEPVAIAEWVGDCRGEHFNEQVWGESEIEDEGEWWVVGRLDGVRLHRGCMVEQWR